jgi:hypothetical protein
LEDGTGEKAREDALSKSRAHVKRESVEELTGAHVIEPKILELQETFRGVDKGHNTTPRTHAMI